MSRFFSLIALAAAMSVQVNAHASWPAGGNDRQVSRLYPTIPGDPNFRLESTPVRHARAVLERSEDGLKITVDSRELLPGAYTIWMRIFNQPELCAGGEGVERSVCSRGSDLADATDPSVPDENNQSTSGVFWLAGALVGDDGKVHISTSVDVNEWPGMVLLGADVEGTDHQAVWNPLGAEVHIVLRYHSDAAQAEGPIFLWDSTRTLNDLTQEELDAFELLGRQLNRFLGNCSPAFGEAASNCEDLQLAVFGPPRGSKRENR